MQGGSLHGGKEEKTDGAFQAGKTPWDRTRIRKGVRAGPEPRQTLTARGEAKRDKRVREEPAVCERSGGGGGEGNKLHEERCFRKG